MKKKPYRSLDQVYLSESFAKQVPPPPRNIVYINKENSEILVHKNPPNGPMKEFKGVSDQLADNIARLIDKSRSWKTKEGKDVSAENIIDEALAKDGWKYRAVSEPVHAAFSKHNLNVDAFENLIAIQTDPDNPTRKLIEAGDTSSPTLYFNLIPNSFKALFNNPEDALKVVTDLFNIVPQLKGINVGRGEVATTLISDAVKGKTGDLLFPGFGEVEFKDYDARMIGAGKSYAIEGTQDELANILSQEASASLPERALQVARKDVLNFIEKALSESPESAKSTNLPNIRNYLTNVKNALDDDMTLQDLIGTIETAIPQVVARNKVVKVVEDLKKNIISRLTSYQAAKKREPMGDFLSSVTAFFSDVDSLSNEQLARGIVACRTYDLNQNDKEQLVTFILQNINFFRHNLKDSMGLRYIIAALHIALYKHFHNFRGIIFATGRPSKKDMSEEEKANIANKKVVFFSVPGNSIGEKIFTTYNFLRNNNAKVNISIDKRGAAAQVSLPS